MKLRKYQSSNGEEIDLICSAEEVEMLREFLEHEGVCLNTSVWSPKGDCSAYVRNPYRQACYGWGSELCKAQGDEFFERGKRGRW